MVEAKEIDEILGLKAPEVAQETPAQQSADELAQEAAAAKGQAPAEQATQGNLFDLDK